MLRSLQAAWRNRDLGLRDTLQRIDANMSAALEALDYTPAKPLSECRG